MAPIDDLKAHATSSHDYYALLDLSPAAGETEVRRAYLRSALKYHPDKISKPTTPADLEKFHLLQIAYDVLSEPEARQLYDNAREARERKRRQAEMMDAAKRKMKEDLEAREQAGGTAQRSLKRPWAHADIGDSDAGERLEREIQRIAEDGRRRRQEAEERLMREAEEERERQKEDIEEDPRNRRVDQSKEGGNSVPELERTVKVRWMREGRGLQFDHNRLIPLLSSFGRVENAFMLKDKRQVLGGRRGKKTVATGVVVFSSIVGAHAAVLDSEKKRKSGEGDWAIIDSVLWASGAGPELGLNDVVPPASAAANNDYTNLPFRFTTTSTKPVLNFSTLKDNTGATTGPSLSSPLTTPFGRAPSFASLSNNKIPSLPFPPVDGKANRLTTTSLEEITLMRLKTAQREKERRALKEQIRREGEVANAAVAAVATSAAKSSATTMT